MAKPSITNIRPPSGTSVWVPPTSTWHLDEAGSHDAYYGDHSSQTQFDALVGQINPTDTNLFTLSDIQSYDYIFQGVNGGSDETVYGKAASGGIIVTGNGKDTVFGGDHGDLIFAGNGADVVHGGGGNDFLFGENGPDQLYGDAGNDRIFGGNGPDKITGGTDTGTFSLTEVEGTIAIKDGIAQYSGNLESLPYDTLDHSQPTDKVHDTQQFFIENGKLYDVFDSKLTDQSPTGDNTLSTDVTVVVYKGGVGNATWSDALDLQYSVFDDGNHTLFAVEIKDDPDYANAKVYVFLGHLDPNNPADLTLLNDPADHAQTNATPLPIFGDIVTTTGGVDEFSFVAGDILSGGNPDPNGATTLNPTVLGPGDGDADTFFYKVTNGTFDGVDKIVDFHPEEGDSLVIDGLPSGVTAVAIVKDAPDTPANDPTVFIAFQDGSHNYIAGAAIELVGYTNPSDVASHIFVNGNQMMV
jgi:hypothetical protein